MTSRRNASSKSASSTAPTPAASACAANSSIRPSAKALDKVKSTKVRSHPTKNSATIAHFPLVLVEWEDSAQPRSAWEWIDDYELDAAILCISVGYVVAETARAIALAPNLGDLHLSAPA
jgi:hypothetical protein